MALLDVVELNYENLEDHRKKPILFRLPKMNKKIKARIKMVPIVRPHMRSMSWINDLSSKIKR